MHTRCAPVRHSRTPEGALTVRLACIRPAASVHPEPGSNSSLYYCLSILFSLNLGFRLLVHPCTAVFLTRFLFSASLRMPVLASDFQRTFRFPLTHPFFTYPLGKRVQKYCFFPYPQALFSNIFHLSCKRLIYSVKFFVKFSIFPHKWQFWRSKRQFWGLFCGL